MNEFLKLTWDCGDSKKKLESQALSFVPDEVLLESYVYKSFSKKLPTVHIPADEKKGIESTPGDKYKKKFQNKSTLTIQQHSDSIYAMRILSQNKNHNQLKESEKQLLDAFRKLNSKIQAENQVFSECARNDWSNVCKRISKVNDNLQRYSEALIKCKSNEYSSHKQMKTHSQEHCLISMNYSEDNNVTLDVNCVQNLLELGTLARFSHPNPKLKCLLKCKTLPDAQTNKAQYKYQLPVSLDDNVRKLLESNDFDVVISSSGLKRLMDNSDPKADWKIPIKVETVKIDEENQIVNKRVVFIDKPLIENQDVLDLRYRSMKRLVKSNFCQFEAFNYEGLQGYSDQTLPTTANKKDTENENREDMGDDCEASASKKKKLNTNTIHHNVNYRVWKFKKTVHNKALMKNALKDSELKLLIRSKLDACEMVTSGSLQPVTVRPKMELQLEYGANTATKSELSREWTMLFFRPYTNLYRVRTHWNTAEVVSIEKCTLQKITTEATFLYEYNPYLGLGLLDKLLNELVTLENGNYMAVHSSKHESFLVVWKENGSSTNDSSDSHSDFNTFEVDKKSVGKRWVPIDCNYILPIHEAEKRLPGCFIPQKISKKKKRAFGRKGVRKAAHRGAGGKCTGES